MSSIVLMAVFLLSVMMTDLAIADESGGEIQSTMITFVAPVKPVSDPLLTTAMLNHYVPATVLTPTTDSSRVAAQVEQSVESKIVEDVSKSDMFRKSSLGKTTTQLETMSQKSVAVSAKSKVEFKVKVVERQAIVTYQSSIKSEVIYTMGQGTIKWVLSRRLGAATEIAFTNVVGTDGSNPSSLLSLNHSF